MGALPVKVGIGGIGGTGGAIIADRSCCEWAVERRCACPRRAAGGVGCSVDVGGDKEPSFVGLLLSNVAPVRALPPMSSLPPRRWPCIGFAGVVGDKSGDDWGDVCCGGGTLPEGLKEKAGNALTDFCLACGIDPLRAAGYCIDIGRGFVDDESFEDVSGPRMGNEKSGLGTISTLPTLGCWRRW